MWCKVPKPLRWWNNFVTWLTWKQILWGWGFTRVLDILFPYNYTFCGAARYHYTQTRQEAHHNDSVTYKRLLYLYWTLHEHHVPVNFCSPELLQGFSCNFTPKQQIVSTKQEKKEWQCTPNVSSSVPRLADAVKQWTLVTSLTMRFNCYTEGGKKGTVSISYAIAIALWKPETVCPTPSTSD